MKREDYILELLRDGVAEGLCDAVMILGLEEALVTAKWSLDFIDDEKEREEQERLISCLEYLLQYYSPPEDEDEDA